MRRYINLIIVFLSILTSSTSKSETFPKHIGEPELSKVLNFYKSIAEMEVAFDQKKTLKELKIALKSKGKLRIHMPDQVVWKITEPSPVTVHLNSKEIRFEFGEGENKKTQVIQRESLGTSKENQSLQSLVVWLQMDAKLLIQDYSVTQTSAKTYEFVPKNISISPFSKLIMTLVHQKYVEELTLDEKSGDTLVIQFQEPKILLKK